MQQIRIGLLAGIAFGLVSVGTMIPLDLPDKGIAMLGAFASRFAIGFLIPNVTLPVKPWLKGLLVALLISLPDAIITAAYVPILGLGAIGGLVIGAVSAKFK